MARSTSAIPRWSSTISTRTRRSRSARAPAGRAARDRRERSDPGPAGLDRRLALVQAIGRVASPAMTGRCPCAGRTVEGSSRIRLRRRPEPVATFAGHRGPPDGDRGPLIGEGRGTASATLPRWSGVRYSSSGAGRPVRRRRSVWRGAATTSSLVERTPGLALAGVRRLHVARRRSPRSRRVGLATDDLARWRGRSRRCASRRRPGLVPSDLRRRAGRSAAAVGLDRSRLDPRLVERARAAGGGGPRGRRPCDRGPRRSSRPRADGTRRSRRGSSSARTGCARSWPGPRASPGGRGSATGSALTYHVADPDAGPASGRADARSPDGYVGIAPVAGRPGQRRDRARGRRGAERLRATVRRAAVAP